MVKTAVTPSPVKLTLPSRSLGSAFSATLTTTAVSPKEPLAGSTLIHCASADAVQSMLPETLTSTLPPFLPTCAVSCDRVSQASVALWRTFSATLSFPPLTVTTASRAALYGFSEAVSLSVVSPASPDSGVTLSHSASSLAVQAMLPDTVTSTEPPALARVTSFSESLSQGAADICLTVSTALRFSPEKVRWPSRGSMSGFSPAFTTTRVSPKPAVSGAALSQGTSASTVHSTVEATMTS